MKDGHNTADYWEARLSANFGLHGTGFLSLGKSYNSWMYRLRKRVVEGRIRSLRVDLNECEVLDIGVGTGFYFDLWKGLPIKGVDGLDLTRVATQNLESKHPDRKFYCLDISKSGAIDSIDRRYEIISAFDILFHITDDDGYRQAIANIYYLLKPNGIFIFSDNFLHGKEKRSQFQVSRRLHDIIEIVDEKFTIEGRYPMFVIMNAPVDSSSDFLKSLWKHIEKSVSSSDAVGYILGAMLYVVDSILIRFFRESPSTEMMICKKKS
jgi:SAM-dependent methyltransferase